MPDLAGPAILARTMSRATRRGKERRAWQYHSRSDTHSKVACWTVLFDLLAECDVFRRHAEEGKLGFRINHVMVGPINKTLDLVVTVVPPSRARSGRNDFATLAERYGVMLEDSEAAAVAAVPGLREDRRDDVSEVAIALEAKACMTEHLKSIPRLHAEIFATGYLARQAAPESITVSYSLVNAADSFVSPGAKAIVNRHAQPQDALRVIDMIGRAIPLARQIRDVGYDVIGVTAIVCRNDGSPVELAGPAAAPPITAHYHYERMIRSLCGAYRNRFG